MERSHPPLRRVMRGNPAKVDPKLDQPLQQQLDNAKEKRLSTRSMVSEQDSCYSSCSEESHASLSRESSDALSQHLGAMSMTDDGRGSVTPCALPPDHLDFALSLGYTEQQLRRALARLPANPTQDSLLAELVAGGHGQGSRGGSLLNLPAAIDASITSSSTSTSFPSSSTTPPSSSTPQLRPIVIDGSNIAMTHGRKEVFSCAGIRDCVNFFLNRGHQDVLVFIPQFRKEAARADCPITDQHVLTELDAKQHIVWTPSRRISGRRIVCHDDRYILKTAEEKDAVIVSNDEYRDLVRENPPYRRLVENRLLMYSFVDGKFMPPDDPLGVPHTAQVCPYGRKCTYGNKCRYYHPERPNGIHTSVTERLMRENRANKPSLMTRPSMIYEGSPLAGHQHHLHQTIGRTQSLNVSVERGMGAEMLKGPFNNITLNTPTQQHPTLSRNASAPLGHQLRPHQDNTSSGPNSRCNSLLDMSMGGVFPFIPPPSHHLFSPSIWGPHNEYALPSISTTNELSDLSMDDSRAKLQYHLSQLFPSTAVAAVMAAHPEEKDPQRLCEVILAFHKGFNGLN
ncbi:unnamed protein product, partial [Mesorhabditis spiculigera]